MPSSFLFVLCVRNLLGESKALTQRTQGKEEGTETSREFMKFVPWLA